MSCKISFNDLVNFLNLKKDIDEKIKELESQIKKLKKEKKKIAKEVDEYTFTIWGRKVDYRIRLTYNEDFYPIIQITEGEMGRFSYNVHNGERRLYLSELKQLQKYVDCAIKLAKYDDIIENFNKVCYGMRRI